MIRSMTAYASAEVSHVAGALSCELRTVNHRYLELSLRLPDDLRTLEPLLRECIAARLARGKVDVVVRRGNGEASAEGLSVNHARLGQLAELALDLQARFPRLGVELTELLKFPGVMQQAATDPAAQQLALFEVLDHALNTLAATREREGAKLAVVLDEKLDAIERIVGEVRQWMPQIREGLRTRLITRLSELKQPVDPARFEQELVLQLTRVDVDEELDRLATHIAETRRVLGLSEPVGRRLDFLMQEFNREANTLGSKSIDARSSNASVELKVLIEQMREQVQNIE